MRKAFTLFAVLFVASILAAPSAMAEKDVWNGQYVDNDLDDDGILNCVDDDIDGDGIPNEEDDCLSIQYGFGKSASAAGNSILDIRPDTAGSYVRLFVSFLLK